MLPATGRQYRGCIIPQAVTRSLMLLKMGKIISRNMLSWLELLIGRYCCIYFGCVYYLYQWCTVEQISDNEIYLLIKYIKSVLWRVAKRLSLYTGRTVPKGWRGRAWSSSLFVFYFRLRTNASQNPFPHTPSWIHKKKFILYKYIT